MTVRVNVGCGDHPADGWVNIDTCFGGRVRPDVAASLTALPFRPGTIGAAYCGHVLEHLPFGDAADSLGRLRALMPAGAPLLAVGPDVTRAERLAAEGRLEGITVERVRDGDNRWPGDAHRWACHEVALADLLSAAGFVGVRALSLQQVPPGWPVVSRAGWQCAVIGSA